MTGTPDEPLVAVDDAAIPCRRSYHTAGWPGTSPVTWLRGAVVERLMTAQASLPRGYGLAIFDGWRSMTTVRALYTHFYGPGSTLRPGFLADPDAPGVPPHLTGGAVDLTLTYDGGDLDLGTPFDEFSDRAGLHALEDVPDGHPDSAARDLRRLLLTAMTGAGFAPFAEEWWHFSHGDADWAEWSGGPALYGATAPPRSAGRYPRT